ncbi:hypothetical protein [Actinomyces sp. oral taxon 849]|nr:hypothetical protein [Actinomyces sp. oral taxon 849]
MSQVEYNSQRLHSNIGYVTPLDEHKAARAPDTHHQEQPQPATKLPTAA